MVGFGRQMDAAINWAILWRSQPRHCRRSDAGSDLLTEREMRMRRDKTGDVMGRPSWRSSSLGGPGAKFLCGKLGIDTKRVKRSKKKERPVGTVGGNLLGVSPPQYALLTSSNAVLASEISEYPTTHPSGTGLLVILPELTAGLMIAYYKRTY